MGTWSVASCYMLICIMTRGILLSRQSSLLLMVDYKPSLYFTLLYFTLLFHQNERVAEWPDCSSVVSKPGASRLTSSGCFMLAHCPSRNE